MIWTIDSGYTIEDYNRIIKVLESKQIPFNEYISTKNYQFYIETEFDPFVLDYKIIDKQFSYFLVAKTKFLQSQESIRYTRRNEHKGKSALKLAYNDVFTKYKDDYITFFTLSNTMKAKALSKDIGRIYYMGRYLNGRYRVFCSNNQYLLRFVNVDDVLASGEPLEAEMELYYNAFNRLDRLKKFSQTPYYENGDYQRPKVLAPFFQSGTSNDTNVPAGSR